MKLMGLFNKLFKPDALRIVRQDIPYASQWESPDLVRAILAGEIQAKEDPRWQESGAVSAEEYADWSWAGCGMACTKMILSAKGKGEHPLVDLAKQALSYGAYQEPLKDSPGMYYRPYVQFLASEYNVPAKIVNRLGITKIMRAIARDALVIASVSGDIRHPESTPAKKGGHLVLVVGYDQQRRELYIHNPSGDTAAAQACAAISFDDFAKFSARRGIIVD